MSVSGGTAVRGMYISRGGYGVGSDYFFFSVEVGRIDMFSLDVASSAMRVRYGKICCRLGRLCCDRALLNLSYYGQVLCS